MWLKHCKHKCLVVTNFTLILIPQKCILNRFPFPSTNPENFCAKIFSAKKIYLIQVVFLICAPTIDHSMSDLPNFFCVLKQCKGCRDKLQNKPENRVSVTHNLWGCVSQLKNVFKLSNLLFSLSQWWHVKSRITTFLWFTMNQCGHRLSV